MPAQRGRMSTPSLTRAEQIMAQPAPWTLDEFIDYLLTVTPVEQHPTAAEQQTQEVHA